MSKAQLNPKSYKKVHHMLTESEVVDILCAMHSAVRMLEGATNATGVAGFYAFTDKIDYYRTRALQYGKRYAQASEALAEKLQMPQRLF